mgnify:CR=1 FL=1
MLGRAGVWSQGLAPFASVCAASTGGFASFMTRHKARTLCHSSRSMSCPSGRNLSCFLASSSVANSRSSALTIRLRVASESVGQLRISRLQKLLTEAYEKDLAGVLNASPSVDEFDASPVLDFDSDEFPPDIPIPILLEDSDPEIRYHRKNR